MIRSGSNRFTFNLPILKGSAVTHSNSRNAAYHYEAASPTDSNLSPSSSLDRDLSTARLLEPVNPNTENLLLPDENDSVNGGKDALSSTSSSIPYRQRRSMGRPQRDSISRTRLLNPNGKHYNRANNHHGRVKHRASDAIESVYQNMDEDYGDVSKTYSLEDEYTTDNGEHSEDLETTQLLLGENQRNKNSHPNQQQRKRFTAGLFRKYLKTKHYDDNNITQSNQRRQQLHQNSPARMPSTGFVSMTDFNEEVITFTPISCNDARYERTMDDTCFTSTEKSHEERLTPNEESFAIFDTSNDELPASNVPESEPESTKTKPFATFDLSNDAVAAVNLLESESECTPTKPLVLVDGNVQNAEDDKENVLVDPLVHEHEMLFGQKNEENNIAVPRNERLQIPSLVSLQNTSSSANGAAMDAEPTVPIVHAATKLETQPNDEDIAPEQGEESVDELVTAQCETFELSQYESQLETLMNTALPPERNGCNEPVSPQYSGTGFLNCPEPEPQTSNDEVLGTNSPKIASTLTELVMHCVSNNATNRRSTNCGPKANAIHLDPNLVVPNLVPSSPSDRSSTESAKSPNHWKSKEVNASKSSNNHNLASFLSGDSSGRPRRLSYSSLDGEGNKKIVVEKISPCDHTTIESRRAVAVEGDDTKERLLRPDCSSVPKSSSVTSKSLKHSVSNHTKKSTSRPSPVSKVFSQIHSNRSSHSHGRARSTKSRERGGAYDDNFDDRSVSSALSALLSLSKRTTKKKSKKDSEKENSRSEIQLHDSKSKKETTGTNDAKPKPAAANHYKLSRIQKAKKKDDIHHNQSLGKVTLSGEMKAKSVDIYLASVQKSNRTSQKPPNSGPNVVKSLATELPILGAAPPTYNASSLSTPYTNSNPRNRSNKLSSLMLDSSAFQCDSDTASEVSKKHDSDKKHLLANKSMAIDDSSVKSGSSKRSNARRRMDVVLNHFKKGHKPSDPNAGSSPRNVEKKKAKTSNQVDEKAKIESTPSKPIATAVKPSSSQRGILAMEDCSSVSGSSTANASTSSRRSFLGRYSSGLSKSLRMFQQSPANRAKRSPAPEKSASPDDDKNENIRSPASINNNIHGSNNDSGRLLLSPTNSSSSSDSGLGIIENTKNKSFDFSSITEKDKTGLGELFESSDDDQLENIFVPNRRIESTSNQKVESQPSVIQFENIICPTDIEIFLKARRSGGGRKNDNDENGSVTSESTCSTLTSPTAVGEMDRYSIYEKPRSIANVRQHNNVNDTVTIKLHKNIHEGKNEALDAPGGLQIRNGYLEFSLAMPDAKSTASSRVSSRSRSSGSQSSHSRMVEALKGHAKNALLLSFDRLHMLSNSQPKLSNGEASYVIPKNIQTGPKINGHTISILLTQSLLKIFEIVAVPVESDTSIGEVLARARAAAIDDRLSSQTYISLCNDVEDVSDVTLPISTLVDWNNYNTIVQEPQTIIGTDLKSLGSSVKTTKNEVMKKQMEKLLIVAIPAGSNAIDCQRIRRVLWRNPRLQRWWKSQQVQYPTFPNSHSVHLMTASNT